MLCCRKTMCHTSMQGMQPAAIAGQLVKRNVRVSVATYWPPVPSSKPPSDLVVMLGQVHMHSRVACTYCKQP